MYREEILKLNKLIYVSKGLLDNELVDKENLKRYKKKCAELFVEIINLEVNNVVNEIAKSGLCYEVNRISNPILRWLNDFFISNNGARIYNAPYLSGHTDSDYNKRYIFSIKSKLEGIVFNLENID